ncbi:MAG: hypothetical protein HY920_08655 [Elusimicrobia bacterium]|nr:hypothetical protein [Elusimicrobiota bacterium]
MSGKSLYILLITVGSIAGGYVPCLWGGSMLSFSGFFFSSVGSIIGFWVAYRIMN